MWKRLKRSRLYFILGGVTLILDWIGRIETVGDIYRASKHWVASRSDVHLAWPPHVLLVVGLFFLALGLVSFIWPNGTPKYVADIHGSGSFEPLEPIASERTESVPHIDLIFDLARSDSPDLVRDDRMTVVNTSPTVAYDVSIQPKESNLYSATFETLARVEKGRPEYAVMELRAKQGGACFTQFEALLKFELENSSEDGDFKVRVPLLVRFYDAKKETLYQTEHEVVYDTFWREAHIHLTKGVAPVEPPHQHAAVPATTPDGVTKVLVKYIMRGTQHQLLAYETKREGFPGTRYLVERKASGQDPKSCLTSNRDEANARWNEWFKEWEKQPGGFGGSFGTGLDGRPPW
jgi:hypothetical protein